MKKFVPELDGLRGFGMLVLLTAHFPIYLVEYNWVLINGFFIMSGFLISRILLDEKNKKGTIAEKFKVYWFRRMLRIFPPYYLYLAVVSILFLFFSFPRDYSDYIVKLLTFTFNLGTEFTNKSEIATLTVHLWSLSVEEQFYLVLPLIIFAVSLRSLKYIILFFILFSPAFRYLLGEYQLKHLGAVRGITIYWHTLSYLDAFFMGVGINVFNMTQWKLKKWHLVLAVCLFIAAGLINSRTGMGEFEWSYYIINLGYVLGETMNYQHVWSYSIINIFFCILIALLAANSGDNKSRLHRFFRFKPLAFLGSVSYSVYVYHLAILVLFRKLITPQVMYGSNMSKFLFFLLYLGVMYLIGYLSFRFFESRFLKMKPKYLQVPSIEHPVKINKKKIK